MRVAPDGGTGRSLALPELPDGYTRRTLSLDDVPAVYELEAAGEAFDDGAVEVDLSDLQGEWGRPDFEPATMSTGVFADGSLVAYAQVFMDRAEALVHPAHRSEGLGTALMRWTWEATRRDGRLTVGQTISENEYAAAALFEANGYEPTHTSWILRAELGPDASPHPVLPPGYRFRPYLPGRDDRELFDVIERAFAEWRGPGGQSMGFENWVFWALHDVDPALIVVLEREGRIVGTALSHDYGPDSEPWIDQVAVAREHRNLGLGRALLEECFSRFWEAGKRHCALSTDSRTGALSLYEHVGMRVRKTYTRWTKTLEAPSAVV